MTDLEARVQRLEDIAAIQQLKLTYADCISAGLSGGAEFPRERFKNLFLPDAIWPTCTLAPRKRWIWPERRRPGSATCGSRRRWRDGRSSARAPTRSATGR